MSSVPAQVLKVSGLSTPTYPEDYHFWYSDRFAPTRFFFKVIVIVHEILYIYLSRIIFILSQLFNSSIDLKIYEHSYFPDKFIIIDNKYGFN